MDNQSRLTQTQGQANM